MAKSVIDLRWGSFSILITLGVLIGCTEKPPDPTADIDPEVLKQLESIYNQEELVSLFGGPSGLDVLTTATKVRAYRIADDPGPRENGAEKIFRYTITSELCDVNATTAAELAAILSDRTCYREVLRMCEFDPAVGFRFENESRRIDVLVCFGCEEIYVSPPGKFADIRSERLLAISKRIFSDDKVIQAIRERPPVSGNGTENRSL